jgi:predicted membrane protein
MGAGDQILDLTSLNIAGLKVNAGVGNITVTLPVDGNFIGTLNAAVGDVTIIVPAGASVNLTLNAALGSVNVPANFTRAGEAYRYGSSSRLVQLKVDTAVGNINVVVK